MELIIIFIIIGVVCSQVIKTSKQVVKSAKEEYQQVKQSEPTHTANQTFERRVSYNKYEPTVRPHMPTVHAMTEETDCEAHKRPESSEGSDVRAHVHTAQETGCEMHKESESSEGESFEEHKARLERKKQEMDARIAFDSRYDQPKEKVQDDEEIKIDLKFNKNSLLSGILYSEILSKPKARCR